MSPCCPPRKPVGLLGSTAVLCPFLHSEKLCPSVFFYSEKFKTQKSTQNQHMLIVVNSGWLYVNIFSDLFSLFFGLKEGPFPLPPIVLLSRSLWGPFLSSFHTFPYLWEHKVLLFGFWLWVLITVEMYQSGFGFLYQDWKSCSHKGSSPSKGIAPRFQGHHLPIDSAPLSETCRWSLGSPAQNEISFSRPGISRLFPVAQAENGTVEVHLTCCEGTWASPQPGGLHSFSPNCKHLRGNNLGLVLKS